MHGRAGDIGHIVRRIDELNPGLILALGQLAARAIVPHVQDRPIVAALVLKMQEFGQTPNVTGVEMIHPPADHFEMIKRVCSRCRTVGVLFGSDESAAYVERARRVAGQYDLELLSAGIAAPRHLPAALGLLERKADVWWVLPDTIVAAPQMAKAILLRSFRQRIPLIGPSTPWVKAGALCALAWDYAEMGRQAGELAVQILTGTNVSELAPRAPRTVLYTLNLKTARHLKLGIPAAFIEGAAETFD